MTWFNPCGLVFMVLIMIPNIIYALNYKDGFDNFYKNKTVIVLEQIGRYGCFAAMIFNVPFTAFGFFSEETFVAYLIVNTVLVLAYLLIWLVTWQKDSVFKALALSLLPSAVFLFSGVMSRSVLLIIAAIIFALCHILISYKNAVAKEK